MAKVCPIDPARNQERAHGSAVHHILEALRRAEELRDATMTLSAGFGDVTPEQERNFTKAQARESLETLWYLEGELRHIAAILAGKPASTTAVDLAIALERL